MIPRVAALLLLLAGAAVAAETSADDTIRFHRVLVPENRVNDWPTGGAKYLPMDASAFERLLEAAKPALTHTPSPPRTAVSAARYKARLVGERLVGSAVLDVAHSDAGPVMLPIDPCNIAIDRPTWRNGATDQEAELGLAADGRFQLRVDRAGRLCFEWSLAGRNDTDDALSFDLELPVGLGNRLDLELPAAASVVVDRGIAIGGESAGSGLRRWEIEWGNNGICRLRILRKGESNAARPQLALLRESRTYECSLRGVDVSAQWRVEAHNRPLREITLLLDAGLQLVSAQLGETEIPWRAVPASDREPARVLLRLPEPISDCERVIRLGAIGPAVLDREWRLPRIRCAQLSWQEGTVTLLATEPLSVNRILPHGCTQTDAGSFGSRGGQSAQFQCFDSDATVDVLLASPAVTLPSSAAQPFSATMRRAPAEIAGIAKPKMDGQPACVKEVRLWSWYQADGAARNVAIYDLRGCGRRLELAAPAAAIRWDVRSVHVDGRPAVWRWTTDETGGRISVTLPTNRPQPRVTVEWTDAVARLGVVTTLAAILPTPRVPVLDSHWVIVPPPGYEPVDATNGKFAGVASADETSDQRLLAVQPLTLTQRLFGSLGRGDVERRFNPLSGDDWMNLWAWGKPKGDLARAWHLEFASQTPATIRLVHRASVQLLSNTILLVTAAIGCWLVGRRLAIIVSMLGVFAALAILLPAVWAPLATGGVLGTIFCLLWRWIRIVAAKSAAKSASGRANEDDRRSWSGKNSDSTVSMAWPTGLLVLAALWLLPVCGEARDGAPSSKTAARGETPSAVSNEPSALAGAARSLAPEVGDDDRGKGEGELAVLVPIDAQRRPAGDKLYVPEPLYLELHRRAAAAQRPPEWIIVGANYKGELVRERSSGRYSLGSLQAEYDLRVFDAGARVQLPLDAAAVRSGGLLVDGQPVEAESREGMRWDSGKTVSGRPSGISIIVAEPGRHRLQVSLWPTICESGASGGFELPAPKAPSARLEMRLPSDAPMLDIPGAIGGFRTATPTGGRDSFFGQSSPVHVVTADLGQTDRLAVRWTKSASSVSRGQATVRADQMLWLRVHPGSVAIAAKFKLHAAGGDVDRVQLAVDPRLRLLPLSGQQRPTVKVDEETSQRRLISFCWPHPIAGETTLEATFLMSGASGVGNASLPLIDLIDAQLSKRWMAVSVDAALDHRERHCEDLAKVRVGDFLTAWEGTESVRPLAAYSIPAGPIRWTLSTRPHEAHCTVDQAVNFGFDTENVDVVFDGRISVAAGYVFEHRLTAPRELKVERVSVLEGDIERALRWAQDDDGITVFLSGPASGVQKLTIRGRMPLRCGNADKWTIPAMRLQKCEVLSAAMRFFEHPGMLVNVESAKGDSAWRMPDKAAAESALGRPVATVGWDGVGPAPMAVTVKPQRSRAATTMAAAGKRNSGDAAIVSGANQPSLSGRPSDRDPFFPRVVAAAATLLCILAAVIVDRRGWLTAIRRRPYAAGVALGLVWWLWLSPSALGLMIAMACIVGAMVGGLRARLRPGLRA